MSTDNPTGAHDGRHGLETDGFEPDERLDVTDLTEDPRLDSEALCLCGLLWSTPAAARRVVALLVAGDFTRPTHAELFTMIADQLAQGRLHDPASLAAVIADRGTGGYRGGLLTTALATVTTVGAIPESAGHHAVTVVTAGYRRSFHTAATAMAQAAHELPTNELFDHLVDIGRAQRAATERLHHVRTALDTSRA